MSSPAAPTATDYRNAMTEAIARAERDAEFCRAQAKAEQVQAGLYPATAATATAIATDYYRRAAEHDLVAAAMRDAIAYAEGTA